MSFGKRVTPSGGVASAGPPANAGRAAQTEPARAFSPETQEHEALVAELRAMARASSGRSERAFGTIDGRLVNEHGQDANPVLARREGAADAREVRRTDYYASSALGNLSAIIGVAGGVAAGFSAQGVLGFTFVLWGLTAVATGRMMQGKAFRERIYMGRAARLAGLGVVLTGAWFLARGWSEPSVLGYFVPDYEAPVRDFFGGGR